MSSTRCGWHSEAPARDEDIPERIKTLSTESQCVFISRESIRISQVDGIECFLNVFVQCCC